MTKDVAGADELLLRLRRFYSDYFALHHSVAKPHAESDHS